MSESPRTTPGLKTALTIAGSDSGGGAGIQADLKTFTAMGVFGCSAITAITAQNTRGVRRSIALDPDLVREQIETVAGDIEIDATKTGMLANAAIIEAVAKAVKSANLFPLVVDPVMVARSGDSLIDEAAVRVLIKQLLSLAAVVTPNRHEAARLLGRTDSIEDTTAAAGAAREICRRLGARACVVTGVRRPGDGQDQAVDLFCDGKDVHEVVSDWRETPDTHGSGCTFSAAITAALALGQPLAEAIETAKSVVSEAIRQSPKLGQGNGPVNHLAWIKVKK